MKNAGLLLVAIVVFGLAACGGKDKPPLTPDDQDNAMGMDGGSETPSTPTMDPAAPK